MHMHSSHMHMHRHAHITRLSTESCVSMSFVVALASTLAGCQFLNSDGPAAPEFGGTIDRSYENSVEWWPEPTRPPEGAPNVVIFLLDDTGFAHLGAFGGLIASLSRGSF